MERTEISNTLQLNEVTRCNKGKYDCIVTSEHGDYAISNKVQLIIKSTLVSTFVIHLHLYINFVGNPPKASIYPKIVLLV